MKALSQNWITENHIDFEYKKYLLLAYLQEVSKNFDETKLYPYLADLVDHYRNLLSIKENKQLLFDSFPSRMTQADIEQLKLVYEKLVSDDAIMQEIEAILSFSIPHFEKALKDGRKIYEFIEEHIKISPVGITPLNTTEGYLFLKRGKNSEMHIYEYQISIFGSAFDKYRGIHTNYITSYEHSIINTFEAIKKDLLRYNKTMPNPATYIIAADMDVPNDETLLPIAKRYLVKYIAANAA